MKLSRVGIQRFFRQRDDDGVLVATSLKVTLTLVSALTVGVVGAYFIDNLYRQALEARVSSFAAVIASERIESAINGGETADRDYNYLKSRLNEAQRASGDISYAYFATIDPRGNDFLVDSRLDQKRGTSLTDTTDAYRNVFYAGEVTSEVVFAGMGISRLSAYAPVRNEQTGDILAVAGADIPGSTYASFIAAAVIVPLIAGGMISAIFITGDRIRARRRQALRFRSELISIASHELRTPLTGIRWGEESLLSAKLNDHEKETMHAMYDSTLRLQESIEDILQLANWQAGRYDQLDIKPTDMTHIVTGIFATQKLPAAQKGMTLEFAHEWPHRLSVNCDEQRMKRVLNNLVSNAIKYGHPNTTVTLDYEKIEGFHLISIKDQGIGIPEAEQEKVFKGFYRATNAVKHEAGGTGMGLYMSRTVIERHGGKLWLTSKEGKGTTVYLKLPR